MQTSTLQQTVCVWGSLKNIRCFPCFVWGRSSNLNKGTFAGVTRPSPWLCPRLVAVSTFRSSVVRGTRPGAMYGKDLDSASVTCCARAVVEPGHHWPGFILPEWQERYPSQVQATNWGRREEEGWGIILRTRLFANILALTYKTRYPIFTPLKMQAKWPSFGLAPNLWHADSYVALKMCVCVRVFVHPLFLLPKQLNYMTGIFFPTVGILKLIWY